MEQTEENLSVEIIISSGSEDGPDIEERTRIDVSIDGHIYPTARLDEGEYVAWWFNADAPDIESSRVQKWVKAPTRFLAAGTLHEVWENLSVFKSLREGSTQ